MCLGLFLVLLNCYLITANIQSISQFWEHQLHQIEMSAMHEGQKSFKSKYLYCTSINLETENTLQINEDTSGTISSANSNTQSDTVF